MVGALLLAASLFPPDGRLSLLDVPYISQSEALCGGAAAAMVLRYWGATGVAAEDFAALVDRSAGGIATAKLARAVEERGWTSIPVAGTIALAEAEIAEGRPVIALIEDRPDVFHYVVVVGLHDRAVVVHDPARMPYVVMQPGEFARRWAAAGRWMLVVTPRDRTPRARPHPSSGSSEADANAPAVPLDACDALVQRGITSSQGKDWTEAERFLTEAVYRCPGAGPWRELAGLRLLQRRWTEVRDLAATAVAIDPADLHAWRLLATSRYVGGDRAGALEAWNRAAEPVVDLVIVSGLRRTTHRSVERSIGIELGTLLTPDALARAARRLDDLPAAFATRIEYVARGSGRVEVRAHVAERAPLPAGPLAWAAIAIRAAAARELAVELGSPLHGGERLDLSWRFWPERPAYGVSLHMPAGRLGVVSVEAAGEEQPFTDAAVPPAQRVTARVGVSGWATGWLRWTAFGGAGRWNDAPLAGTAGLGVGVDWNRVVVRADLERWQGGREFSAAHLRGEWRSTPERRGVVLTGAGGAHAVSRRAPLETWPAGDAGHARTPLLRAHPVLDDGRLAVDRLGRALLYGTVEGQRWWRGPGPLAVGGALFVDAARTSSRLAGEPLRDVDAGAGLRVALPGAGGVLRVDVARGLRDGRTAVSLVWHP